MPLPVSKESTIGMGLLCRESLDLLGSKATVCPFACSLLLPTRSLPLVWFFLFSDWQMSEEVIPEYYQRCRESMDLSEMERRLQAGLYFLGSPGPPEPSPARESKNGMKDREEKSGVPIDVALSVAAFSADIDTMCRNVFK